MKILVFADLHYFGGEEIRFDSQKKLVQFAIPMLKKLIETADREDVALTVNLGDIIQDTNDKALDLECLSYMFSYLKKFKSPCYSVLGNHDLKMMDAAEEVEQIMGYPSRYSMDVEGFHLVFLTTDVMPALGTKRGGSYKTQILSEGGVAWLKKDLANNNLPCLIFTHFPVAENEAVQDECMFLKNRDDVKQVLRGDKNVKAVFSGHQHPPKLLTEDGIPHYIVGSPTYSQKADGIPLGVFVMIETAGENVTVTEHCISL